MKSEYNNKQPGSINETGVYGTIFDIKRFAIHDGPGIRTTVFLKGCPLSCQWCHNPESISPAPQLTWRSGFCIGCGSCISTCPANALSAGQNGRIALNKDKCTLCGQCARICPADALSVTGRQVSAREILAEVEKDRVFYDNSAGGVTFSGGEPLAQPDFLAECLKLCRQAGLHCTVDTSCYANPEIIDRIAPLADLFLCDIKHTDSRTHKQLTGVGNDTILANIRRISELARPIIIRVPMIPGVNDSDTNLAKTREFVANLKNVITIEYLPYNPGGIEKREMVL